MSISPFSRAQILLVMTFLLVSNHAHGQDNHPLKKANDRPETTDTIRLPEPFDLATVSEMSEQCALLQTEVGDIQLEFFPEEAPVTVRNFLNLVSLGAFDMTVFSRIVRNFVVQGGNISTREDATVDIRRRANRRIPDEPNRIRHERGIVSLARPDEADRATSHFFILVADSDFLDGKFAAFGRVLTGMEVVDRMNAMEVDGDKPLSPVRLKKATLYRCQDK
jgi:peptidyl-prolyl cis-trans isomerase B (cyclophilin B)